MEHGCGAQGYRPAILFREQSETTGTPLPDNGATLKRGAMAIAVGPSCPLHLGVLDSLDYWTDEALVAAVRPLSAYELHQLALGSERRKRQQQGKDLRP